MAAEAEDFGSWADEIDWDLRYDDGPHAGQVISKLLELGFTITAPPMPPFTVTYNGHPEFRCGSREEAELFLSSGAVFSLATTSGRNRLTGGLARDVALPARGRC
jgi:hypothetical protein